MIEGELQVIGIGIGGMGLFVQYLLLHLGIVAATGTGYEQKHGDHNYSA
jgi:hypothetical protein